ncbi:hypothetical protein [Mucilaginibacter sp. L196]|uniref:hypothetical protein n=1 Tax=Mucilaginibacter sp. L196 TaxID=1641870 RepID=UPI00131E65D9|nr:hypothetical protein [Mucilaginibacter sp. L196]
MKNLKEKNCVKKEKLSRILISRNEDQISTIQSDANWLQTALKDVIDYFNVMEIGEIGNTSDLNKAVQNPIVFYDACIAVLVIEPVQQGHFKVSKEAYLQTLELPDNRTFLKAASTVKLKLPHLSVPLSAFEVDENCEVKLNTTCYDDIINKACLFAETDAEITAYELMSSAIKALQKFAVFSDEAFGKTIFKGMYKERFDIESFATVDLSKETRSLKVNPKYFLTIKNTVS